MPELPEVETVMRGIAPALAGQTLVKVAVNRAGLRAPFPKALAKRLTGRRVLALSRRAKYILIALSGGETLVLHLGMSGRLRLFAADAPTAEPHDHVVLYTAKTGLAFNDPRRFGLLDLVATEAVGAYPPLAGLGPEPLSEAFDAAVLAGALAGKRTPIKTALLDQRVVAGLGNIYVCEALFRARVAPTRAAASLSGRETKALTAAVKAVLTAAIAAGGSSLSDARYRRADGALGYFQTKLAVYDRQGEACPRKTCAGRIERIVQAGRSSFFCPVCQH